MVAWECPTNPREASGLDPEAVHYSLTRKGEELLVAFDGIHEWGEKWIGEES